MQNAKLSGCFDGGKPAGSRFFMPCVRKKQLQVIQIPERVRKIGEKIYKFVYKKSMM